MDGSGRLGERYSRKPCPLGRGQYDIRMQKARVTVTVRRDVLAKAERNVKRGRAKSVSAWVDSAMEEKARREDQTRTQEAGPDNLRRIDAALNIVRC